jgi:hypothetical protein
MATAITVQSLITTDPIATVGGTAADNPYKHLPPLGLQDSSNSLPIIPQIPQGRTMYAPYVFKDIKKCILTFAADGLFWF